jgi:hypothetical protein
VGTDQTRPSESAPGNPILLRRPADNVTAVTPERPSGQPGHPHGPTAASSPATGHTLLAIRECRARLKAGPGAVKGAPRRCPTPGLAPRRAKNRGARRRPNPTPLTAPGPASASLRCFECRGACALNSRRPRRSAPTVRASGLAARQGRSRGPEKRATRSRHQDPARRERKPPKISGRSGRNRSGRAVPTVPSRHHRAPQCQNSLDTAWTPAYKET